MSTWQEVEDEFACDHPDSEIRYKLDRLNRKLFVEQCLFCGAMVGTPLKYADVENKDLIMPFDQGLADRRGALIHARWQDLVAEQDALHQSRKSDWWQRVYTPYINSPAWQDKRSRVLERDGYLCQACRKRRANQVHHLTYRHFEHEPLFDLVAICDVCHAELHEENSNEHHANGRAILPR